jgi:hypothetical protein
VVRVPTGAGSGVGNREQRVLLSRRQNASYDVEPMTAPWAVVFIPGRASDATVACPKHDSKLKLGDQLD